ncbi:RNA polymerase sigma factor [Patescibacteria group bacterium]|nr:RNA polymerase sigma factor [Patescibacteria group bacterium]
MANSRKIFSKIYDEYINKIYRFIFLKVSSQEIAEDLCSETFLRGWRAFKNQREIENPPAFLYQIARNLIVDFYRERDKARIVSTENIRIIDPRVNLEEEAYLNSDLKQIRLVLANLKEDYQDVIIYRYLDDLSIPEIAKILDKSEGAVRVMLHRALKALKNKLNPV